MWITTVLVGVLAVTVTVVLALPEYAVDVTAGGVLERISALLDVTEFQY